MFKKIAFLVALSFTFLLSACAPEPTPAPSKEGSFLTSDAENPGVARVDVHIYDFQDKASVKQSGHITIFYYPGENKLEDEQKATIKFAGKGYLELSPLLGQDIFLSLDQIGQGEGKEKPTIEINGKTFFLIRTERNSDPGFFRLVFDVSPTK